jgi:hypothetical protein
MRAKFTSLKQAALPLDSADMLGKSRNVHKLLDLPKSANSVNQFSLSKVSIQETVVGLSSKHITSKFDQSSVQIMSFIQSLGLPQDTLSSSLISFFKFFSLPLDAQVLKQIRREIPESKPSSLPKSSSMKDSAALAASAAFDKGLRLSSEALQEYAAAIDPAEHKNPNEHRDAHGNNSGSDFEQSAPDNPEGDLQKRNTEEKKTPHPDDIKNLMAKIDASDTLLGYANNIPGKNGKYWIILPFNFTSETSSFSVTIRLLLDAKDDFHRSVDRLAVDILHNAPKIDHRWIFFISKEENNSYKAQFSLIPEPNNTEKSHLLTELKKILGDLVDEISFVDEKDVLSFMDSRNDVIFSVNEEA